MTLRSRVAKLSGPPPVDPADCPGWAPVWIHRGGDGVLREMGTGKPYDGGDFGNCALCGARCHTFIEIVVVSSREEVEALRRAGREQTAHEG